MSIHDIERGYGGFEAQSSDEQVEAMRKGGGNEGEDLPLPEDEEEDDADATEDEEDNAYNTDGSREQGSDLTLSNSGSGDSGDSEDSQE